MLALLFLHVVSAIESGGLQEYDTPNIVFKSTLYNENNIIYKEEIDRVKIQLYYECLCPDCMEFDTREFKDTVVKLDSYLDVFVYPYGYAEMTEKDGKIEFTCQHGPKECYGNKLHACAIDYLNNVTAAVCYNACMMDVPFDTYGSNDETADKCGKSMNIDSNPIKECAKGDKGTQLLKYYGEETEKANISDKGVPYTLINGVEYNDTNFMQEVCKKFKSLPPACNEIL